MTQCPFVKSMTPVNKLVIYKTIWNRMTKDIKTTYRFLALKNRRASRVWRNAQECRVTALKINASPSTEPLAHALIMYPLTYIYTAVEWLKYFHDPFCSPSARKQYEYNLSKDFIDNYCAQLKPVYLNLLCIMPCKKRHFTTQKKRKEVDAIQFLT